MRQQLKQQRLQNLKQNLTLVQRQVLAIGREMRTVREAE